MKKKYDFLIVGAGMFGAVCAHELRERGFNCLVIDRRSHLGGNCYTELIEDINVHKYGAHIFHTNDEKIWNYVNSFVRFNRYTNSPLANYKGKLYNLPFNMNTFYQLWKIKTPKEAIAELKRQTEFYSGIIPQNLEEQALSLVGKDIYEKLIKGYTEKQWGRSAKELPTFIIKRLPLRFTFDNNYFNDIYQGIPIGGYTSLFEKLLYGIELRLDTDFFIEKQYLNEMAYKVIYTGPIDRFYNYEYGKLKYRSLKFESEILDCDNFQGNSVINYTDKETPYTRIIEHKHFEFGLQSKTVISKEFSIETTENEEPYYPINDEVNNKLYAMYHEKSKLEENVYFGGRLAEYKYYDMHQVIGAAFSFIKEITNDYR